jgi:hypothetical protein
VKGDLGRWGRQEGRQNEGGSLPDDGEGIGRKSSKFLHSFASSFGGFGLFLFSLDAGFVVKAPLLDLGKETFLGQFSFQVFDGLLDLVILNNNFHNGITSFLETKKHLNGNRDAFPHLCEWAWG